ncbi:MAG: ThiF family adenylyltransferase [Dokdonella sp.]|uniref:ThiF family adenylyltransferase n=1 Tax=Dokdonella sp. TaxID=2291710 RepID=UPI0025BDE57E|nr:ThiF family adenylyltransferase [Dokdonella sp.]MBZ0221633.1 ThiF family adenylyltransferase [Dokdonella sp.]
MTDAYHELANVTEVGSAGALTIPRACALLDAVQRQRDYSLIRLLRHPADGAAAVECLIVEVECDGIPPKNQVGIRYLERLALCVSNDPKRLIEVLALRQDFPILMHQNQGVHGAPASLCLYFDPPAAVLRTWTPAAFLRRIQWWLEMSARGELHPADQPVEHLFFASRYELILPWNLAELRKNPALRFMVLRQEERPDQGFTCFLQPISKGAPQAKTFAHIELTLPPIVHGFVERDPATLGQLANVLTQRNVDLITPLRAKLQDGVGESGAAASADDKATVILLHIPIKRSADVEPDGITHRAFLVPVGVLELGVATGALLIHQGRYFKDLMNQQPSTAWQNQPVLPMDVLAQNDAAAARRQSGIFDEGPKAVLIGAGSLGSALLNLWGRSGWGRWTVIDKDHIKPHNLSRHAAYTQHVGETKATVVAGLHAAATEGATEVVPIVADATDLSQEPVAHALTAASLVVDASTTLEYPRAASGVDTLPRHCSVFITPDGNAAVLLAEDAGRTHRLRTLEAQYYRALIQEDWGKTHLSGHANTFWSGASCRDISAVMPYSRIMGQASTLAEQVQAATANKDALIRAWQRDRVRGAITVHDVPVLLERRISLDDLDVFIDDGVEQQLRELRRLSFPNETGGVLLGYYDFNIKAVMIVAGLPAPPDSKASRDSFERGITGLTEAVKDASVRTAGMVSYIGEWHSHPRGHSASPSGHDLVQLIQLALGMSDDGLPAIQLIVGEHDLQVLQGEVK